MRDVLRFISAPAVAPAGASVTIGLIDSGIYSDHPDLKAAVQITHSADLVDRSHHGTHLAGVIAGRGIVEADQCRGVAPQSTILPLKIIDDDRTGQERFDVLTVISALHEALKAGVDIINLSVTFSKRDAPPPPWAWPEEEPLMETLRYISQNGILCVVAAGNDGPELGTINFPAGSPHVLTVGAIDTNGLVLSASSRGPYLIDPNLELGLQASTSLLDESLRTVRKPDLVVSGSEIWGPHSGHCVPRDPACETRSDGTYVRASGTSQAAAVATGLAACALEYLNQNLPIPRVARARVLRNLMIAAAGQHPGPDWRQYGAGVLLWPALEAKLELFVLDPEFRDFMSAPDDDPDE